MSAGIEVEALGAATKRVVCTAAENAGCIGARNKSAAEGGGQNSIKSPRTVLKSRMWSAPDLIEDRAAIRCRVVEEVVGATIANEDIAAPVADERIGRRRPDEDFIRTGAVELTVANLQAINGDMCCGRRAVIFDCVIKRTAVQIVVGKRRCCC